jgi:uncharacterized protein
VSRFRHPDFLTPRDEPMHRLRCPIHGFLRFSENERQVIDHPLFRRLRYVRQLALTEFVYPGATHTRFEHSLGVMEMATRAFDTLAAKRGDRLEASFREVEAFKRRPLARARQVLRLAALLHDVGHASFSHAAEAVVLGGIGHESLTIQMLRERQWLGRDLERLFWRGCAQWVAQVLEGGRDLPPQLRVLRDLVSGEMDADRSDYLLRDSHHCGVDYGRFDHRRMIECLETEEAPSGGLEIALHRDGIHTFEALIVARYQMNTQVYYHRLRRIYDLYLIRYHEALGADAPDTPAKVLAHSDTTMMAQIFQDAARGEGDRGKWAQRICNRSHHRVAHETGANATAMDLRRSEDVLEALRRRYPDREFIPDVARARIHKLLVPEDEDERDRVTLTLVSSDGMTRQVGEESQILRRTPRWYQCARIFVDVTREQTALRDEIRAAATREWRDRGGH